MTEKEYTPQAKQAALAHGADLVGVVKVEDLKWRLDGRDLYLEFFLRKGAYATTFLRELMKNDEPAPGFLGKA